MRVQLMSLIVHKSFTEYFMTLVRLPNKNLVAKKLPIKDNLKLVKYLHTCAEISKFWDVQCFRKLCTKIPLSVVP